MSDFQLFQTGHSIRAVAFVFYWAFQSSSRADVIEFWRILLVITEQYQSNFRAFLLVISEQFQSSFRAVSEQFQSSFRAAVGRHGGAAAMLLCLRPLALPWQPTGCK